MVQNTFLINNVFIYGSCFQVNFMQDAHTVMTPYW